ncbi:AsmA family protein [Herminiimonas contaminans]|uniref:AsmA family protein n=1 Tax=Herminiimonas contaminans TaxID=1111140 RepID=A0ABS0EUY4_9BURK|nr:AsmA family protein [Herminiimonas contaminans]MBF8178658.1 AsmA family protein [Herminiimonas contaminans]
MRRWHKVLLSVVVLLLVLAAAGGYALQRLTDSTHLTELARSSLKQNWNRDLTIGGLSLDLLPYPRLRASDVRISNPDWAQDKYALQAEDIRARLALAPLLRGDVVVEGLLINGLTLNLEVAADGRRSWDLPVTRKLRTSQFDLLALRADVSKINFRSAHQESKSWQLDTLRAKGSSGLRNLVFNGRLVRAQYTVQFNGQLDDLSGMGTPGAVSKGVLTVQSGQAQATVTGQLPLDSALQAYDVALAVEAESLKELYGYLQIDRTSPVPLQASVKLQASEQQHVFKDLKLQLGKLNLSGAGQWSKQNGRTKLNASLHADHIDMKQTFLDIGQPPLAEKKEGELFRDKPLAWPLLAQANNIDARVAAAIDNLKLRSGVEVEGAQADLRLHDDTLTLPEFSGKLLGGSVHGDIVLEGKKQAVKLNLQLNDTSLGAMLKASGKELVVNGGAMKVDAKVTTHGSSMKDLAAGLNGPVEIRIGSAQILSPAAGQAEFWLTGLFSSKDSKRIDMACASGRLPFVAGVAKGVGIVGARSDASQLLTSGQVNLQNQTVDLRGKVRVRSGFSLGISNFSDEVKIVGALGKPELKLDESGALGAIARIGAAILTSGVSIVATSIWDGANPKSDPCQVVFSSRAAKKQQSR